MMNSLQFMRETQAFLTHRIEANPTVPIQPASRVIDGKRMMVGTTELPRVSVERVLVALVVF